MGEYLATSAFRHRSVSEVVQGIGALVSRFDLEVEILADRRERGEEEEATSDETSTLVTAPRNGWTVVLWPEAFVADEPFYRDLSAITKALLSTVQVYDGGSWDHWLFNNGKVLDLFASDPTVHPATPQEAEPLRQQMRGDAEVIAAQVGISPDAIRPYLEYRPDTPRRRTTRGLKALLQWLGWTSQEHYYETIKAFPEDEFDLGNPWVFVDFWRRLGIAYPEDADPSDRRVRFPAEALLQRLLAEGR
jgi:hypothetical protein